MKNIILPIHFGVSILQLLVYCWDSVIHTAQSRELLYSFVLNFHPLTAFLCQWPATHFLSTLRYGLYFLGIDEKYHIADTFWHFHFAATCVLLGFCHPYFFWATGVGWMHFLVNLAEIVQLWPSPYTWVVVLPRVACNLAHMACIPLTSHV